mmetsp:Transcript_5783/g.35926  ORF Transcript_5783/g.35926 Transcript_5783/m.35926 type:complete len:82 (-) Transcript_5783:845-1090(-)
MPSGRHANISSKQSNRFILQNIQGETFTCIIYGVCLLQAHAGAGKIVAVRGVDAPSIERATPDAQKDKVSSRSPTSRKLRV